MNWKVSNMIVTDTQSTALSLHQRVWLNSLILHQRQFFYGEQVRDKRKQRQILENREMPYFCKGHVCLPWCLSTREGFFCWSLWWFWQYIPSDTKLQRTQRVKWRLQWSPVSYTKKQKEIGCVCISPRPTSLILILTWDFSNLIQRLKHLSRFQPTTRKPFALWAGLVWALC